MAPATKISRALWLECWETTGRVALRRVELDRVERRLSLARRLGDILHEEKKRGGPLPYPYAGLSSALHRWAARDQELLERNRERLQGLDRHIGRNTRLSSFLHLMFQRDPSLPTTPGPWMRACDDEEIGSAEVRFFDKKPDKKAPVSEKDKWQEAQKARARAWKDALKPYRTRRQRGGGKFPQPRI